MAPRSYPDLEPCSTLDLAPGTRKRGSALHNGQHQHEISATLDPRLRARFFQEQQPGRRAGVRSSLWSRLQRVRNLCDGCINRAQERSIIEQSVRILHANNAQLHQNRAGTTLAGARAAIWQPQRRLINGWSMDCLDTGSQRPFSRSACRQRF